ncbi:DUF397 domain-containing protein [Streptomyces sp. NPDC057689]|uniref:DUF397 domain-containing protein n=1 Tax=Streptomyces sp. NPDC057689 TaxID=3346213 RepID=UPI0036865EFA
MKTTDDMNWFKSSYSGGDGDNCVEIALRSTTVHVRDSKDTTLPSLSASAAAWSDFTAYASDVRTF